MSTHSRLRSYLIFTGSSPILVVSTYPKLTDERLLQKLRYKGIHRFIAYEVELDAVAGIYGDAYSAVATELGGEDHPQDLRVLDFNGHQIMANLSLDSLGDPIKFGG